jgi:hypothetical protein
MRKILHLTITLWLASTAPAQTIPQALWGKWIVKRALPTRTISCWDEQKIKKLIGTELEYSSGLFRWGKVVTKNPSMKTTTITASQFHDEYSGGGANDSQVTFQQLEIKEAKIIQVEIKHPAASITGATIEIPGDRVLLKDQNTIVFSVCNVYFEAKRSLPSIRK